MALKIGIEQEAADVYGAKVRVENFLVLGAGKVAGGKNTCAFTDKFFAFMVEINVAQCCRSVITVNYDYWRPF